MVGDDHHHAGDIRRILARILRPQLVTSRRAELHSLDSATRIDQAACLLDFQGLNDLPPRELAN